MNNTEKKLDALIDALGFDVEEFRTEDSYKELELWKAKAQDIKANCAVGAVPIGNRPKPVYDYKLTKRKPNNEFLTLNKIIDQYEEGSMSASEMIGRIMLMEGVTNEDL